MTLLERAERIAATMGLPHGQPASVWYASIRNLALRMLSEVAQEERQVCERLLTDMQSESVAYLRGVADGLRVAEEGARQQLSVEWGTPNLHSRDQETVAIRGARALGEAANRARALLCLPVDIPPAGEVRLRVGAFVAELDAAGLGKVELDDRPVEVRGFTLRVEAGHAPQLQLDVVPLKLA